MKVIPLTRGMFTKVDDEDYERVLSLGPWNAIRGAHCWYAGRGAFINGKKTVLFVHHVVMGQSRGIDHANLDGLDNQKSNLRRASWSQQRQNTRLYANNTTGEKGVCLTKRGKYVAQVDINGKRKYLGIFTNFEDAALVARKARTELFGEFARTSETPVSNNVSPIIRKSVNGIFAQFDINCFDQFDK